MRSDCWPYTVRRDSAFCCSGCLHSCTIPQDEGLRGRGIGNYVCLWAFGNRDSSRLTHGYGVYGIFVEPRIWLAHTCQSSYAFPVLAFCVRPAWQRRGNARDSNDVASSNHPPFL